MFALLWTSWKVRDISDGYFIKLEFRYVGICWICYISAIALSIAFRDFTIVFLCACVNALSVQCSLGIILLYPIWKSFEDQRLQKQQLMTKHAESFTNLLITEQYAGDLDKMQFKTHLTKVFSAEYILFYEAALEFEKKSHSGNLSNEEMSLRAAKIYYQFIADLSPDKVLRLCIKSLNSGE